MNEFFSNWISWNKRNQLDGIKYPGVYCLAFTNNLDLSGHGFSWLEEIVYVGMSNAVAGIRGRLNQFDSTIQGKRGHGGADRFRYKYDDYNTLVESLYVAIKSFECDVKSIHPYDLLIMGDVAYEEYKCFSEYSKRFNRLPEFNDKGNSPKYSLTKGRQ
jgi:hypothetical protein